MKPRQLAQPGCTQDEENGRDIPYPEDLNPECFFLLTCVDIVEYPELTLCIAWECLAGIGSRARRERSWRWGDGRWAFSISVHLLCWAMLNFSLCFACPARRVHFFLVLSLLLCRRTCVARWCCATVHLDVV